MLIVSEFHDYYDTASIYGIDKTIIYQRKIATFKRVDRHRNDRKTVISLGEKKEFEHDWTPTDRRSRYDDITHHVIGFCGKLYPVVEVEDFRTFFTKINWCYNEDEAPKQPEKKYYYRRMSYKEFFDVKNWNHLLPLFHTLKCPIFLFNRKGITTNTQLKPMKFYRMIPPPQAFQDIQSYISGVLGMDAKPIITISDKDKAAAKGHDGPYSFRKPPGGGRWR